MPSVPGDDVCWCGAGGGRFLTAFDPASGGPLRLVRCEACGTARLSPRPGDAVLRRAYDAAYYGAPGRKFVGPVARAVARFQGGRARLASGYLPPGGRVLDVGCGTGGFLLDMQRRGYRAEGTERSAESAARVPPAPGLRIHVGDLLALDLPERGYDLVTMWHVFEHLAEPAAAAARVGRLLVPGGALLLSLPNADAWQARLFGRHWFHHDPPRHLFGFGPRSLARLLDACGFRVERIWTFSLEQNPYGVMQSVLNAAGFPRDRAYEVLKGQRSVPAAQRALDLALLGALGLPALLFALAEAMAGRGGTMVVSARSTGG